MAPKIHQLSAWDLARMQHGVIARLQLLALGFSDEAIKHRIARGRLRQIYRGVYAVGQMPLTQQGRWMAAVLACGDTAALSHDSAAARWGLMKPTDPIHVSVLGQSRSRKGIEVHRRIALHTTRRDGIPTTTPAQTLIDLAPHPQLEQMIGEADLRRIISLKALRTAAAKVGGSSPTPAFHSPTPRPGRQDARRLLLAAHRPRRGTDGGWTHRTAAQQTEDRKRDQAHLRAGRTPLRITHAQVFYDAAETTALLVDVFTACQCRRELESTLRAA